MQEALGIVIVVVTILAAIIAVVALVMAPKAYDQIGRGGLSLRDEDKPPPRETAPAVRDDEIRQLLTARNARRARKGQETVDVEEELARLTKQVDPGLRDEVRQLVIARNARRARKGQEPLDVDAEVERQLRELSG